MSDSLADLDLSANRIELARRGLAGRYIDLTSSNPTHQGLLFPAEILHAAADRYWATRRYDPDPHGLPAAREAIVRYYDGRRAPDARGRGSTGTSLSVDDVFITASTSEAYGVLFALLAGPGDNILAPDVSYPLFEYLAAIEHVELRPYRLDEERGWQIDPDSLRDQVDRRTRAILVISPHNPTGATVQAPQPVFDEVGLPVICDEVFAEFEYRAPRTLPVFDLHPGLPVFTLNGISKMFALPDLKLGWIALNRPAAKQYAERLELINDTFLGANTLTQTMLPALFEQGMGFVDAMRSRTRTSLDQTIDTLSRCARLRIHPPDGGYYLFPRVLNCGDEEELVLELLESGVLTHPGYYYGCESGRDRVGHLMISCLTEPKRLSIGIERLVAGLGR